MAQDGGSGDHDPGDYRYFGPFGPPGPSTGGTGASGPVPGGADAERTAPLGVGQWSYVDQSSTPQSWSPAPPVAVPTPYGSASGQPFVGGRQRRPLRGGTLLLLALVTSLLIGGAAGYAGSRLAERTGPPSTSTAPADPSVAPSDPAQSPPSAPSSPLTAAPGQPNSVAVAKAVVPSTVMIQVGSGTSSGTGSGFVLDGQGRIMTNNHVVAAGGGSGRIRVVYADGTRAEATLVGRSPSYDLAVIKVAPSSRVKPIRLGNSDASQVGEPVVAVGSPLGLPGTVTAGIVSAKDRPVVVNESGNADSPTAYINAIQTDAPINPGNSGGPLVDSQARVIGVNSAILTLGASQGTSGSIGLGFAIPINQALEIGQLLIKNGKATYPVIGANVSNEDTLGVRLTTVEAGGPAARAGLRPGDVVAAIDGRAVGDIQQLIVWVRTHRPGERVRLDYTRSGAKASATVILGSKEG
jgi:putative serine protease PepD